MSAPRWVSEALALAVHDRQIAEHGGTEGIRDSTLLESALARPQQLFAYGEPRPDHAALAASLAFGIARNHPFVDGNKRTAAVLCELYLGMNGHSLEADDESMLATFLALAAGELSEDELADWLRRHAPPAADDSAHDAQEAYAR